MTRVVSQLLRTLTCTMLMSATWGCSKSHPVTFSSARKDVGYAGVDVPGAGSKDQGVHERTIVLVKKAVGVLRGAATASIAATMFGGKAEVTDSARSWRVALPDRSPSVIIDAGPNQPPDAIRVYLDVDAKVVLRDLLPIFGQYHVVHEGEESSVKFATQADVRVFAALFSSRIIPDAQVISVTMYKAER